MRILWIEDQPGSLSKRYWELAETPRQFKAHHEIELLWAPNPAIDRVEQFDPQGKKWMRYSWNPTVSTPLRNSSSQDAPVLPSDTMVFNLLKRTDVLILDLNLGIGLRKEWKLTPAMIAENLQVLGKRPTLSEDDVADLADGRTGGAAFFHYFFPVLKQHCQAVIVLTNYEGSAGDSGAEHIARVTQRFLDPYTQDSDSRPHVSRYVKQDAGSVFDRVDTMVRMFCGGFTKFDNLYEIEFAASHDEPVMIVGESGTGKEGAARAIHDRWTQRWKAEHPGAGKFRPGFVSINCSMLGEEYGRIELFGALDGSYTSQVDHVLGRLLADGCGIQLTAVPEKQRAAMRREDIVKRSNGRLKDVGHALEVVPPFDDHAETEPVLFGTLFLDEFGDLPSGMQSQLLRYLGTSEAEIGMRGLDVPVRGAYLRVITATSDPRFAAFAGVRPEDRPRAQWRTDEELRRPLRQDLLFRVKGQVIRMEPVTAANVEQVVDHLISRRGTASIWPDPVREHLVNVLKEHIDRVNALGVKGQDQPIFGHKREIDGLLRLAEANLATARMRGVYPPREAVSIPDVERLFNPAVRLGLADPHAVPVTKGGSDLRRRLEEVFREAKVHLDPTWKRKEFLRAVNDLTKRADKQSLTQLYDLLEDPVLASQAIGLDYSGERDPTGFVRDRRKALKKAMK